MVSLRKPLFIIGVLLIAWLFVGHMAPRFMPAPPVQTLAPAPDDGRVAALQARIGQLETKVKALEEMTAALPKPSGNTAGDEKITALQASVNDLQAQITQRFSVMSALAALKDAALAGEPFGAPMAQLSELTKDNPMQEQLSQLAPYAESGTGTLADLQRQFEALIPQALAAKHQGIAKNLESLIRIRKTGEPQGNDDEAILARAEARMNHSDIKAMLKEMSALSPAATDACAAWIAKAQGYLRVRETLTALALTPTAPAAAP